LTSKANASCKKPHTRDISQSGALFSGLDIELSPGVVIGILYAGKKARYRSDLDPL